MMQDSSDRNINQVRIDLRGEALARREAIPSEKRSELSASVSDKVLHELDILNARFVHCYISFRSEVETRSLIDTMLARGIRVVVPVVEGDGSGGTLVHTEIQGLTNLRTGAFGIEEPVEQTPSALEALDAIIIPMVAFDRHGARLGYGKGFYDRFLRGLPCDIQRMGLAFSVQEVAAIPLLPHDERVETIFTELERIAVTDANTQTIDEQ
ncbi:MAG: 5-formyltetrahydrofolate cyclo-ligase [Bacteroidota bacterium]|nr:5-formyltetrahydrofolate cyclo-ligase [Bacteroidota bacterium]MDP4233513.1 5-formyltetrahydrofolate cyclo-ligase [Bacteroidota bacterium]MDP4243390.1 5-formyltetrahydrofolate cyclo-ligase [Bacteroidota bacterium]MDP4287923.1 5-formyltetrahydrofolate cyclo-ligase [Bacteroidota bacterium]